MSLGFERRHIAIAAMAGIALIATLSRKELHGVAASRPLPTEIVVNAEEVRPPLATMTPSPHVLRVCADPNNLPFSNARGEGFENKLAGLTAKALNRQLQYYWQPQRRGFIRTTLRAGTCDVVMGVLSASDMLMVTKPYYRSTYVFVSKQERRLHLRSFDDPRLKALRIGIQMTGEDYGNPPPAQALAARHIVQNVRGFTVFGDYSKPYPQRGPIDAVQDGRVDVAVVWGPIAGYFGQSAAADRLDITPVVPGREDAAVPFAFDISMAVRRGDAPLAAALNRIISERSAAIDSILAAYHVPRVGQRSGV
jgi:mxaJ protein